MRWRDFNHLSLLPDDFFSAPRRVHFIGIGGIGMSALALALKSRGHFVSGSDACESAMLQALRESGIETVVGHSENNLRVLAGEAEAVIFGSAISQDNSERIAAKNANLPQWHRAQLLAHFVNNAKCSIAVSGTHGKSTTSAMIAHILTKCGKNPTALLGAVYPPFGSNVRLGDPDLVVVEADESDGSFTLLHPTISVVTNVEAEHLENYDDSEDELWRAFEMFAAQTRREIVLNADDAKACVRLAAAKSSENSRNPCSYSIEADPAVLRAIYSHSLLGGGPQLRASNLASRERHVTFDLTSQRFGESLTLNNVALGTPGRHNVSNALAALMAVEALRSTPRVSMTEAAETLADFHGVKRRFQFIGEANDILLYDDYGHHPTEVASTLETAREFLKRPIVAIFQPHRYSRTQQMGHLFGPSFQAADRIIITQLYSAFEDPIEGISGRIVFESVRRAFPDKPLWYAETLEEARRIAVEIMRPGDAVICLGAGDITTLPPQLLEDLK